MTKIKKVFFNNYFQRFEAAEIITEMEDELLHLIKNKIKKKRISVLNSLTVKVFCKKNKNLSKLKKNTNLKNLLTHSYLFTSKMLSTTFLFLFGTLTNLFFFFFFFPFFLYKFSITIQTFIIIYILVKREERDMQTIVRFRTHCLLNSSKKRAHSNFATTMRNKQTSIRNGVQ